MLKTLVRGVMVRVARHVSRRRSPHITVMSAQPSPAQPSPAQPSPASSVYLAPGSPGPDALLNRSLQYTVYTVHCTGVTSPPLTCNTNINSPRWSAGRGYADAAAAIMSVISTSRTSYTAYRVNCPFRPVSGGTHSWQEAKLAKILMIIDYDLCGKASQF